ncbi:MAG: septum formation protein Maf [Anaerolineales bacterium]|nr:septum formation protein Maf [Anaerolineales bacterium]
MRILLASNSPRRRELLSLGGWPFEVVSGEVDERPTPSESSREYVLRLAQEKAKAGGVQRMAGDVVVAADTAVVDHENGAELILGKPQDALEAESMLGWLRGRIHRVYSGIAVLRIDDDLLESDVCCTAVPMRHYSDDEMLAYIATGDPLDKAGAYAIQHPDFHPVENLSGCYANVMGLPLCHLTRILASMGLLPKTDIAAACQTALHYKCSIYSKILAGDHLVG